LALRREDEAQGVVMEGTGLICRLLMVAAVAVSSLSANAFAAENSPASLPFALKSIGTGVYAAIDGPKGDSGSNAGFVIGDDDVLVIDSIFDPEATKALIAEIRKLTPLPIRYVVNTHYHVDHVGGDAVLQAAGAIIVAHRNVHGWVRTENLHLLGNHLTPKLKADIESLALPDMETDKGLTIWLGKRKVIVQSVLGHTGGDLVVRVPDAKVLFCGDILWNHVSPNIIDGTVARWVETIDTLTTSPGAAGMTFVPGHGDIATFKGVKDFATYLGDLKTIVQHERAGGLTGEDLIRAALAELARKYGDWTAFSYFAPLELGYMEQELAGVKRTPKPVND
jgi:cyclase